MEEAFLSSNLYPRLKLENKWRDELCIVRQETFGEKEFVGENKHERSYVVSGERLNQGEQIFRGIYYVFGKTAYFNLLQLWGFMLCSFSFLSVLP